MIPGVILLLNNPFSLILKVQLVVITSLLGGYVAVLALLSMIYLHLVLDSVDSSPTVLDHSWQR